MKTLFDMKQARLYLVDGTSGTPNELELELGEGGTFTYNEKKVREYIRNRGVLNRVRNGNEDPVEVSFDLQILNIVGATTTEISPEDALKKRGGAADWVSSDSNVCNPYALDIKLEHTPECETGEIETILLADFRYEELDYDFGTGRLKVSGKCNIVAASSTRTAQSV